MNYYAAKELAESFRTVRKNTLLIAQDIPQEKYNFRPAADTRSVAELLAHIALAHGFQYQVHATERRTTLEGFDFPSLVKRFAAEEKEPGTRTRFWRCSAAPGRNGPDGFKDSARVSWPSRCRCPRARPRQQRAASR